MGSEVDIAVRSQDMDTTLDQPTDTIASTTGDTVALARLERVRQGFLEAEYSYGGEADLHRHYDGCLKNPGHKNFIPVDKFSIQDLPEDYRDTDVVDYIRAVSDLTVRVSVKYVSDRRPATEPGSRTPYPRKTTVGTGYVVSVDIDNIDSDTVIIDNIDSDTVIIDNIDSDTVIIDNLDSDTLIIDNIGSDTDGDPCKCKECKNSLTPERNFAIIYIETATHVVFDKREGQDTTCHLFFDRGNIPETCPGVVALKGMKCVSSNVNEDISDLTHFTHDLNLARRLHTTVERRLQLGEALLTKIPKLREFKHTQVDLDRQPLLFIVSHPHGCSKQISLGRWTSVSRFYNDVVSYLYNTGTCPGSSGAQVCVMQECGDLKVDGRFYTVQGIHSGVSKAHRCFNVCHKEADFPQPKLVNLEMMHRDKGSWKDGLSFVEEDAGNKHDATCQENPGNQNCFPLETLTMDHLPSVYRKHDVIKFVKLVSDLTVRVSVNYVSEKRLKTVPGTDIPIPWYNDKGSNQMRVGNGWIDAAEITDDVDCRCQECRNSSNPKRQLAFIIIKTAAHLVYDELETEHTACHLSFVSAETPAAYKEVALTGMNLYYNEIDHDSCSMEYCTHDLDLVGRLKDMINQHRDYLRSLNRDPAETTTYVKQNGGQNAKQENPLYIMAFHHHGGSKHVSISCCGSHGDVDTEDGQFPQTKLCPDSSGAPVIMMGWQFDYPVCE